MCVRQYSITIKSDTRVFAVAFREIPNEHTGGNEKGVRILVSKDFGRGERLCVLVCGQQSVSFRPWSGWLAPGRAGLFFPCTVGNFYFLLIPELILSKKMSLSGKHQSTVKIRIFEVLCVLRIIDSWLQKIFWDSIIQSEIFPGPSENKV